MISSTHTCDQFPINSSPPRPKRRESCATEAHFNPVGTKLLTPYVPKEGGVSSYSLNTKPKIKALKTAKTESPCTGHAPTSSPELARAFVLPNIGGGVIIRL